MKTREDRRMDFERWIRNGERLPGHFLNTKRTYLGELRYKSEWIQGMWIGYNKGRDHQENV